MDEAAKTASIAELATEIFVFALGMRDRAGQAEYSAVYPGALRLFEEFESRAKAEKADPDEIAAVKFALAAFVDEVILSAEWPGRDQWGDDPLQLHFFGTYLAGEGFFQKMDELRAQGKARAGALEVFYLCLVLGFKGKYGVAGEERLQALRKVVQGELEHAQSGIPRELSPHWQLADGPAPHANTLPRWFVYACAAVLVVCLMLYAVLFFSLRSEAGKAQPAQSTALLRQTGMLDGTVR
jgi:type VI secretion system protein ImpK